MPFPGFLTDFAKPCQIVTTTAGAAAATDITSTAVDMADYEGCLFLVAFGAIVTNAVTTIKLQQADDSGGSPDDFTDIVGTSQTVADDKDNTSFVIDFRRPQKRYLKLIVTRATQNATVGVVYAIPYNKGSRSDLSASGTAISGAERFFNVAEGTA